MTPTEMEDKLDNFDRRLEAVEQILPTLATKSDLNRLADGLRDELRNEAQSVLTAAKHHTDIRIEDVRDDIRMLADSVTGLITTTGQVQKTLETVVQRLDVHESILQGLTKRRRR